MNQMSYMYVYLTILIFVQSKSFIIIAKVPDSQTFCLYFKINFFKAGLNKPILKKLVPFITSYAERKGR